MAEPFIGEIRFFSFAFAPKYWAQCNGQTLPINQNQALYALLGTAFGGDGRTNFKLPDLRGRTGIGMGPSAPIGQVAGAEAVALTTAQMPMHTHQMNGSVQQANALVLNNNVLATIPDATGFPIYGPANNLVSLDPGSIDPVGGSQPHPNMQPFTTVNQCIALTGIFPPRP